tara:strand:- start:3758 stop:4516 length:759 start_codon:yes stop_codon:yes gene_type:complete
MTELTAEKCLVIPDVHQDIEWVERIFDREIGWDRCVFLGDYFDPKGKPVGELAGVRATARYIRELTGRHGDQITLLWGNHDIPYWEMKKRMRTGNLDEFFYGGGVASRNKSRVHNIFKEWDDEFVGRLRLFTVVNGRLLSHAGLARSFWPEADSIDESLGLLERQSKEALLAVHRQPHPLLAPGQSRGGSQEFGGLTWQCWIGDFCDTLPLPQIVGHTASSGVRQKGKSFCIDGTQTCYAVIKGERIRFECA